uniref:Uncharacterized protein n=1 Tax=Globisporangium ultimum (strain ATCC 200006 / CBS 805.95 / DAOM BR144) TaxID=431595 RepID=K3X2T0_GLOUD
MSTGTVIGIVAGIIGGVAILAFVTMTMIRRKRDNDDDPLSPFELSMDKGYNGAQGYGGQNAAGNGYNNNARGNAPVENGQQLNTDTPPANSIAAGVAYSQFYDVQTSPGSGHNQQRRASSGYHEEAGASNATNLWMSAMEPKDNESYLSAKESQDDDSLHSGGRNSYDVGYHDDQSSQISGSSDLNSAKDFPDYEDESARGSYEL